MRIWRSPVATCLCLIAGLAGVLLSSVAKASPDLTKRDQWVWWEDDQNAPEICLDGSATGFGYYVPSNWNKKVLFFLDGGGLCYDQASCNPANIGTITQSLLSQTKPKEPILARNNYKQKPDFVNNTTNTFNLDANGAGWFTAPLNRGIFDPNSSTNPFQQYMRVFIPYCTGDMHLGYRTDNSATAHNRTKSGMTFYGLWDSYVVFYETLQAVQATNGANPPTVVLSGGSAGGFGAIALYGLLRNMLGASSGGTQIITISDSGMPLFSGTSSNGSSWQAQAQGFFGLPGTLSSQVDSMEEQWFDAWGSSWATYYPSALVESPLGPGHASFLPIQEVEDYNWIGSQTPGAAEYGDRLAIIDGSSDWMYWVFTPLFMNDSGMRPDIGDDAQKQVQTVFPSSVFFQITSKTNSGPLPLFKHHTFIEDDVSTWGSNGSNLAAFFKTLPL